ncbi:MAG TPA: hypothetical protein V6C58_17260 [Allocoleopsis sp.]
MIHSIPCYDLKSLPNRFREVPVSIDSPENTDEKKLWDEVIREYGYFAQNDNRTIFVAGSYTLFGAKKRDVYVFRNVAELVQNFEQLKYKLIANPQIETINTFVIENIEMVS